MAEARIQKLTFSCFVLQNIPSSFELRHSLFGFNR